MMQEKNKAALRSAIEKTAPDDIADVFARIDAGKAVPFEAKRAVHRSRFVRLAAACLALMLLGGAGLAYRRANAVTSVVSIDVNPSIELRANADGRVLSCAALNDDAQAVLAEMDGGRDLRNTKLSLAVDAVIGSLLRHGYLDSLSSSVLISVEDDDEARCERLRRELAEEVDAIAAQATVLSRAYGKNAEREALARQSGVSTGKIALAQEVRGDNDALDFQALTALSVEELRGMAETGATQMPIGRREAARIAAAYAGAGDGVPCEVESELDETPPCYEVEFEHPVRGETEYRVHAYTGEVLSGEKGALNPSSAGKTAAGDIGDEAAKRAALKQAGLGAAQVQKISVGRDNEDGRAVYEVGFTTDGVEYEYTVDAETGSVLEWEIEPADRRGNERDDGRNDDGRDDEGRDDDRDDDARDEDDRDDDDRDDDDD